MFPDLDRKWYMHNQIFENVNYCYDFMDNKEAKLHWIDSQIYASMKILEEIQCLSKSGYYS